MMESESVTSSSPSKTWSQTWRGRLFILIGITGLFALVFWLAMKSRQMVAAPAGLVVDEKHLSFGEVWENPAFVWNLPIRNSTNEDLEIAGFETSCSCGRIDPKSLVIPAGQTHECRLTLDLTPRIPKELGLCMRDFEVRIIPHLPRQTRVEKGWTVSGKVRSAVRLSSRAIDYGASLVRGQQFSSQTIKIDCCVPLKKISANCRSSQMESKLNALGDDKKHYELEIKIRDSITAGPFEFETKLLMYDGSTDTSIPAIRIPIRGVIQEDVYPTPASVMFGIVPIGQRIEENIVLQSYSGGDFAVENIEVDSKDIVVSPVETIEITGKMFRVSQRVMAAGHHTANIFIVVRPKQNAKQLKIAVPVLYHGVQSMKE